MKETAPIDEYPIDAPIIWNLGIKKMDKTKFVSSAKVDVIKKIFVFLIPCSDTERMFPETKMELAKSTITTGIEAGRYSTLERNRSMGEESAATSIAIGT